MVLECLEMATWGHNKAPSNVQNAPVLMRYTKEHVARSYMFLERVRCFPSVSIFLPRLEEIREVGDNFPHDLAMASLEVANNDKSSFSDLCSFNSSIRFLLRILLTSFTTCAASCLEGVPVQKTISSPTKPLSVAPEGFCKRTMDTNLFKSFLESAISSSFFSS
ncbi:hypothetical protein Gasu2_45280 [Galdieria sulphuraria]|nr:hypothetical protein Gasu2_45280 [Galdieria sulphuraria]